MLIRDNLIKTIENSFDTDTAVINDFKQFIDDHPADFFSKKLKLAHVTSSVFVVDESGEKTLLTHHAKFDKWLQMGGHWSDDGSIPEETVLMSSLREMKEEAFGGENIKYELSNDGNALDLDIHAAGDHLHYDVCYLVRVSTLVPLVVTRESKSLEWVDMNKILENSEKYEKRLTKMIEKYHEIVKPKLIKRSVFLKCS